MDAIPSLCASSASCAVATIGCGLAQSRTAKHRQRLTPLLDHLHVPPRRPPSTISSTPSQTTGSYLPRPVTSPQLLDSNKRLSGLLGLEEEGDPVVFGKSTSSRPHTGSISEEGHKRSSWYRRFSSIPPSIDGSVGSPPSQHYSSPSIFSNGSSAAPFLHKPVAPVTPRNRLVKRSTSFRGSQGDYPVDPFAATGRGPTFRRPATSHQRLETLKLRSVQQNLANIENSPALSGDSWSGKGTRSNIEGESNTGSSALWRPFFRYQRRCIARDPQIRKTSGSRKTSGNEYITTVVVPTAEYAMLVVGSLVERPKMDIPSYRESLLEEQFDDLEFDMNHIEGESIPIRKTRHSFSTETKPVAVASWKLDRGGSLRDGKASTNRTTERRIVSAPQQESPAATVSASSGKQRSLLRKPQIESQTMSADHVHMPGISDRVDRVVEEKFTSSTVDTNSGISTQIPQIGVGIRSSSKRGSRVPSDRSTTFGSEAGNSHVFSEMDDADERSETVFDSLRTEASGSSHSGARNYRVENVFGDPISQDPMKHDLSVLHEKLSAISINNNRDLIVEEEDLLRTPIGRKRSEEEDNMATPSARKKNTEDDLKAPLFNPQKDNDIDFSDEELSWDDELGIDTSPPLMQNVRLGPSISSQTQSMEATKARLFDWSEPSATDRKSQDGEPRPKTSHPEQSHDRGGRPAGRRVTNGLHYRSQSVPLPPDASKHKFNNAKKLDDWKLGKGVSEDWDDDFAFEEPLPDATEVASGPSSRPISTVVVPKDILAKQETVHIQFGQVKELTLLVEELRKLYSAASKHGILEGQASKLWEDAAGIIDLATVDEEESLRPPSPTSTAGDFDNFDEDQADLRQRRASNSRTSAELTPSGQFSSPGGSRYGTPRTRPRHDSVTRAKNVLANIHQHRDPLDTTIEIEEETESITKTKKMPFDTTSLRDLVTRAGAVYRVCKDIIRKIENPGEFPSTPERRSNTPPDPPFVSQIFQQSPAPSTPSSDKKGARAPSTPNPLDHEAYGYNVSTNTPR